MVFVREVEPIPVRAKSSFIPPLPLPPPSTHTHTTSSSESLCREPHVVPRPVKISTQLSVHHTSEPTDTRQQHSRGFTFTKTRPTGAFKKGIRIQIESAPKNLGTGIKSESPASSQLTESVEYMKLSMTDFANQDGSDGVQKEEDLATGTSCFRSLLLFIPLRLGQERFNPEYTEALKVMH